MNKCLGCGKIIDNDKELCQRCFNIRHYNKYEKVEMDNQNFIDILTNIPKNDLVLLVTDLFNLADLKKITKYLPKRVVLVLTKRDILPLKTQNDKFLDYDYGIKCLDKIIISSNKNFQIDELYELIYKYKKSNNVYLVGYTNAGKSTLINKLLYNYSTNGTIITTSPLPSTTLDVISIKLNDELTLMDTPGVLDLGDITNYVSEKTLKQIVPLKEIKPKTYQLKGKQSLIVSDILRLDSKNTNITFFISNKLNIERIYKETDKLTNLIKHELEVKEGDDIVIQGLGFIKVTKGGKFTIYTLDNVNVYTRKSLI